MGGFYWHEGSVPGRVIIFLQGGGLCFDKASCASRKFYFKSSSWWPAIQEHSHGLFSRNCDQNPYWCNASYAYVPYCTSDFYSGDRAASPETFNMHFRGTKVIDGIIDTLIREYIPDHVQSPEILWSGCSAGGKGTVYNMDRVQLRLPNARALTDSDWWVDFHTFDPTTIDNFVDKAKAAYSLWNSQMNQGCVAAHRDEPWMCIFPYKNEPYYKMPHMTQEFLYDWYQLGENTNWKISSKASKDYMGYAEDFRKYIEGTLSEVKGGDSLVFAPACYLHCSTESPAMWSIEVNGKTLGMHLAEWMQGDLTPETGILRDSCKGFNCGTGCPVKSAVRRLMSVATE